MPLMSMNAPMPPTMTQIAIRPVEIDGLSPGRGGGVDVTSEP